MKPFKKAASFAILSITMLILGQFQQAKADAPVTSSTSYTYSTDLAVGAPDTVFNVSQFDTAGGTLQLLSVEITLSGVITSSTIGITVNDSGRVKGTAVSYGFLTLSNGENTLFDNFTLTTADGSYVNIMTPSTTTANSGSTALTSADTTVGTDGWADAGTVALTLNQSYAGGIGGSGAVSANASEAALQVNGNATVTVTYKYCNLTAVPEPSSWAMIFSGLGMLIVARQFIKRTA